MKRLFWLGLGVAAGVALSRKASQTARAATPAGIAGNLGDAIGELAGALGTFGADIRAGAVFEITGTVTGTTATATDVAARQLIDLTTVISPG